MTHNATIHGAIIELIDTASMSIDPPLQQVWLDHCTVKGDGSIQVNGRELLMTATQVVSTWLTISLPGKMVIGRDDVTGTFVSDLYMDGHLSVSTPAVTTAPVPLTMTYFRMEDMSVLTVDLTAYDALPAGSRLPPAISVNGSCLLAGTLRVIMPLTTPTRPIPIIYCERYVLNFAKYIFVNSTTTQMPLQVTSVNQGSSSTWYYGNEPQPVVPDDSTGNAGIWIGGIAIGMGVAGVLALGIYCWRSRRTGYDEMSH
jgi:hypothetical protein